jgi:hypothetical protein
MTHGFNQSKIRKQIYFYKKKKKYCFIVSIISWKNFFYYILILNKKKKKKKKGFTIQLPTRMHILLCFYDDLKILIVPNLGNKIFFLIHS